jgi:hypothetical protein
MIHIQALFAVLSGQKNGFSITSKTQVSGNFIHLNWMHLVYIGISAIGTSYYLYSNGITVSLFANITWIMLNIIIIFPFLRASLPELQKNKSNQSLEYLETVPINSNLTIDK